MPFAATWMDLEILILSEVFQTEKDKYDIACMWNLKEKEKDTNELISKTERDRHRKQIYGYQRGKQESGEGYIRRLGLTYTHYYV